MSNERINRKPEIAGFSLVEVMISMFVFSVAFIALITLSQQTIKVNNVNKNGIMASQLAQEGIEIVRQIKEEIVINPDSDPSWADILVKLPVGTYRVDLSRNFNNGIDDTTWKQSASILADDAIDLDNDYVLRMNADGLYQHTGGPDSIFRRMIRITHLSGVAGDRIKVNCLVRYRDRNVMNDYTAIAELYDWY